jgi:hypothetical protein
LLHGSDPPDDLPALPSYIDVRGDFDDSEIATPTKTVPSKRGSVYGFEAEVEVEVAAGATHATHAKPRLNLPPPPPPPAESGARKGSGQWEEMDFSAKRSKLGASINLSTMLPGARPAVGLRKSVYVDDGDGGDNTTCVISQHRDFSGSHERLVLPAHTCRFELSTLPPSLCAAPTQTHMGRFVRPHQLLWPVDTRFAFIQTRQEGSWCRRGRNY